MVSNVSAGSGDLPGSLSWACKLSEDLDWKQLQIGDRIDIVCETVLLSCDGKSIMKQCGTGEFFVLFGDLKDLATLWTIFHAKVVDGKWSDSVGKCLNI